MAINSRAKGKRNELIVANMFKQVGFPDAKRGQQYCGMDGNADVVGIPHLWVEVKAREQLNLLEAIEQAERDSAAYIEKTKEEVLPVVIHKRNCRPWKCTMRTIDFLYMCGSMPFTVDVPPNGLVTMLFTDWIEIFKAYHGERSRR